MKILDIAPAKINDDYIRELEAVDWLCPEIITLTPSPLSFLTALSIAGKMKKEVAEYVLVHRVKDLSAAVAARRICRERDIDFKIIATLTGRNAAQHIPPTLAAEIDALVYQTPTTPPQGFKGTPVVIGPQMKKNIVFTEPKNKDKIDLVWHGTPDKDNNIDNILTALWNIEANDPEAADCLHLTIYGQGRARYVMPLVRKTRLFNHIKITWDAEQQTSHPEAETSQIHKPTTLPRPSAIFIDDPDATFDVIASATQHAIPVIDSSAPSKIKETIYQLISANPEVIQQLRVTSDYIFKTQHSPMFHVEQWRKILIDLK